MATATMAQTRIRRALEVIAERERKSGQIILGAVADEILASLFPEWVERDQVKYMENLEKFHEHPEGSGGLRFVEIGFRVPEDAFPMAFDAISDVLRPGLVSLRLTPDDGRTGV